MMHHGYSCKAIPSLEELNIEDQETLFDLIISDILFEGIAPLDFVFQIREILQTRSLIIVTNMGQQKVRQQILSSKDVKGFFAIPFDLDDIQKLIA